MSTEKNNLFYIFFYGKNKIQISKSNKMQDYNMMETEAGHWESNRHSSCGWRHARSWRREQCCSRCLETSDSFIWRGPAATRHILLLLSHSFFQF